MAPKAGEIRYHARSGSWWIVDHVRENGAPIGHCILQGPDREYTGWWIGDCEPVDDNDIPGEVWAETAKWRLLNGD